MIDTQAIRNKILDLALRGQLTEQLPEDGTAEELYQQIQEEKRALIEVGKIKKEKPLPENTESESPFEIPKNWKWVKLGNITTKITSGSTPTGGRKSNVYVESGFPLFREQNIYDDGIHQAGMVFITEELLKTRKNSTVLAKDILLNITGGSIGRCALVPDSFDRGSINQHILIIRAVDPETRFYLHMLICSPYIQSYIKNKAVGDKDGFSGGRCKKILVPLPPIAEQQRIVEKIDQTFSVLDTIDTLQAQYVDNLTALKAKLIDAAIRGKLTEQLPEDGTAEELYQKIQAEKQELIRAGKIKKEKPLPEIVADEISIEIPANWKSCRLGSIITLVSGTDYKPEEYNAEMRGTPYITGASNLLPEGVLINRWTEIPRCIANKGDVLLVCKGSGYGKVAMCDIEEAHIARQIMALKKTDLLDMRYILYYLVANFSYLKGKGQGLIPGVDRKSVLNMIFPLPPLAEQKRITQKIDELLSLFEK